MKIPFFVMKLFFLPKIYYFMNKNIHFTVNMKK